jgi:F0F1-type ATP synthase assembly protein I
MDWRGFYDHLYLWEPWFLVWGLLLGMATLNHARHHQD